MATYAVGDVQGCLDALRALLERVRFDPARDRLWLTGDLVNRGSQSLETLRFVRGLGDAARCVLGNHDIHLLMVAGRHANAHRSDTLDEVLGAPDRDELLAWLRQQPLMHQEGRYLMVHAGLLPEWTLAQAQTLADEAQRALRDGFDALAGSLYGNQPERWDAGLRGRDRIRFIVNVFTRMRVCHPDGRLDLTHKGLVDRRPAGTEPWFDLPHQHGDGVTVVCGHWSALGLLLRPGLAALDTGCLWGGWLTALRLEDGAVFQVRGEAERSLKPG
ncbi:MAG: symmetrical bis(5'-nucleosyl)-tetraphosphatase [Rhodocyclaceae bacterium]|nr:symmetrical bis(5'-nucleosyl)-tetraphosphatase [Rhodocyclaceae bacterium]